MYLNETMDEKQDKSASVNILSKLLLTDKFQHYHEIK